MRIIAFVTALVMGLFASQSVAAQSVDVDLEATDGVTLKATYHSPGRPGPGMLLIHQCNMDRSSWDGISSALVESGVHAVSYTHLRAPET